MDIDKVLKHLQDNWKIYAFLGFIVVVSVYTGG